MSVVKKSALDQIREHTVIVADTGCFDDIAKFHPVDVTTNPSLLLQAADSPSYSSLEDEAVKYAQQKGRTTEERAEIAIDKLFVLCGREMLKIVPGRVSTEIDARLSFDVDDQVRKARNIIKYYEEENISKDRVLIKLSSTWEGIKAAEILERDFGIHCNMTLLFNFHQAIACAEANATLISPYVGRIYDWHVKHTNKKYFPMLEDPGVINVTKIYNYYKQHGYETQVMAASFRNTDQIKGLCGCDFMTISPTLLGQLSTDLGHVDVQLKHSNVLPKPDKKLTEKEFRWYLNEDEMTTDRLSDGIRVFARASVKLEEILLDKFRSLNRTTTA